ncbi:MAG: bifunctional methylenetetrahydrofolate dehydrogenase/methenyltetrahydrofolate cyclohydrolase FolD [Acidobacteriia bacterium]|nr:bifunctional methylenetetrahydrofolate dehydrogenase/methenyltetrahydrofolate cyclohydrolase FolD [Terriglobia bacterium]
MTIRIIDGIKIGKEIREELRTEVALLKNAGLTPGLAAVLVGDDPASRVYVNNKIRACESLGIFSKLVQLSKEITTEQLLEHITALNQDDSLHGILVQLPLPKSIDEKAILVAIDPAKDVDGLHPFNAGNLVLGNNSLRPCTPSGIIEILRRENISTKGAHAVVIGRSNLVGKPLGLLLLENNATVTFCHSQTQNLTKISKTADILVVAVGKPIIVDETFVKPGAVVIDVGINRIEGQRLKPLLQKDPSLQSQYERNRSKGRNSVLAGDVNLASVSRIASAVTPVPGGVGPLTIALLMKNTVKAARKFT